MGSAKLNSFNKEKRCEPTLVEVVSDRKALAYNISGFIAKRHSTQHNDTQLKTSQCTELQVNNKKQH